MDFESMSTEMKLKIDEASLKNAAKARDEKAEALKNLQSNFVKIRRGQVDDAVIATQEKFGKAKKRMDSEDKNINSLEYDKEMMGALEEQAAKENFERKVEEVKKILTPALNEIYENFIQEGNQESLRGKSTEDILREANILSKPEVLEKLKNVGLENPKLIIGDPLLGNRVDSMSDYYYPTSKTKKIRVGSGDFQRNESLRGVRVVLIDTKKILFGDSKEEMFFTKVYPNVPAGTREDDIYESLDKKGPDFED